MKKGKSYPNDDSTKFSSSDFRESDSHDGNMGKGPKGYKRSDVKMYEEVCETLLKNHDVDASDIEVHVDSGVVRLKGGVNSKLEKRMAENCLKQIPGLVIIKNEIQYRQTGQYSDGAQDAYKKDLGVDSFYNEIG